MAWRRMALAVALTFLLGACENPGPVPATAPSSSTVQASPTPSSPDPRATPAPAGTTTGTTAAASSPPALSSAEPAVCVDPAMDLASTALGAWLGAGVIPTLNPGESFDFEVADNQFSPCGEMSWVVLSGTSGEPGAVSHDAVIFFAGPDLLTTPAPVLLPTGAEVTTRSEDAITVTWEGGGEAAYRLSDIGLVVDGEPAAATRLDLGRAGPPARSGPGPYGNAYTRPWDQERPPGQRYSMAIGQKRIICDFELFNDLQLVCYSPTDRPWPMLRENIPAENGDRANVAVLNFQSPWAVSTLADPFLPRNDEAQPLPEEAVTRIGDVFVDTRNDVVKIYDSSWAYVIGDGFAMPAELPGAPVDTSRWPQDLRPWDPGLN